MYPVSPGDTVMVEDPVSINLGSAEFREFREDIGRLCTAIVQSNKRPERLPTSWSRSCRRA